MPTCQGLTMVSFILTTAYVNINLWPLMKSMPFKLVYSRAELGPGNLMFMLASRIERNLGFFCVQTKLPQEVSWQIWYKWICTDFHYIRMWPITFFLCSGCFSLQNLSSDSCGCTKVLLANFWFQHCPETDTQCSNSGSPFGRTSAAAEPGTLFPRCSLHSCNID